ncbi:MAG: undecaprenyl-phosphate glucose phosphotransferase [Lachnospiraceae bacterium]|nr:undecaprenyl-phosphate glucose phosphotransferase [Lachnospiraceae bacterium]
MIKSNQQTFNRIHVLVDAVIIVVSYLLAYYIRIGSSIFPDVEQGLSFETYLLALVLVVPGYLALYDAFRLYTSKRMMGRRAELLNLIKANTTGILAFIIILFVLEWNHFSKQMLLMFYGINVIIETIARYSVRKVLERYRANAYNLKHVILVGYSRAAEGYIDRMYETPELGYKIHGILDNLRAKGAEYRGVPVLGELAILGELLETNDVDEIVITLGLSEYDYLESIVSQCEKSGVHTKFVPDYNNIIPTKPYTEDFLGLPVINIRHVPLTDPSNRMIKRAFDVVVGSIALVVFSPIMIVTALAIKLTSKGPIIFAQERVGLHNKPFKMYKFRSMEVQRDQEEKSAWTKKNDARVTKVGKIIRKLSIDEFPQLINVLKGEMSLVGPRPERPFFVEKFKEEVPRYMVKHQVRPGMTGWAQINGYRGDTSIKKRIEYDLYYIENWSLLLDIKIMILTVFKGFINKNAY